MKGAYATDMLDKTNEDIYTMVNDFFAATVKSGTKPEVAGLQADGYMAYLFKSRRVQREAQTRLLGAVPA